MGSRFHDLQATRAVPAEVVPRLGVAALPDRVTELARALARLPTAVLLGALVVAITGLDVLWRTRETRPPHWDMGHHLSNSLLYFNGFSLSHPLRFAEAYVFYPPLVYWVTDVFYAVLGNQAMWVAILSNVVWLAVLVFATYGIGRRLWNARIGWLSVVFVVTAPMVVSSAKEYMLDVPLAAVAALALYLLLRTEEFTRRRDTLLFGVVCGFGLLVKWTLPLVLALPVLNASANALAEARLRHRFNQLVNLAGAAALTFAIAGIWYVHNLKQVVASLAYDSGGQGAAEGDPPIESVRSALWYFWNLVNDQLYVLPFILLLVGVVFCVRKRELAKRNLYPILMIVGTYLAFSLLQNKDPRYMIPLIPPIAIVATSWLEYVPKRARVWMTGTLVTYGAVAFLAISFGTSLLPRSVTVALPWTRFSPGSLVVFEQHGYIIGPPTRENWHQVDSFKTMARLPRSQRTFAYRGPDTIWFNKHGLNYYSLRYDARWAQISHARFLIARGKPRATLAGYARLQRWHLPDGGSLALYERL